MVKSWRMALILIVIGCALSACAPAANPMVGEVVADKTPAGFLLGWWHGFTVLFTFVVSLFNDSVGMYEVHNSGWPYNLGFLFGIMMFFGGGGGAAGSSRGK